MLGAAPVNAKTRIVSTTEAELINKAENQENTISTIQPKSIFKVIAWVVAVETLVLFAVLGYTGCFTNGNDQCDNQSGDGYLPLYAFVVIFFLSIPWFSYLIRKVRDSFYIRLEFQCALSAFFVFFLLYVLDEYTDALQSISPGPTFWMWLAVVITHTICVTIPAVYAFYYKYLQKSILVDNTMEAFNKVLMDHRLFASFKKTLAEDFSIENGLFWDDWLTLQPTDEKKTVDIPKTVLHMYETYIQVGAKYELNISSTCRKKISKEIAEKNYKPEILEAAKNEVFQMMYLNSFPRFVMKVKNGANNSTVNTSKNQTTTGKQSAIDGSIIA
ncbi:RGS domain-containing protein [Paraphysoderma sedebokerense]|nr:RGS domain-containing protein [Paraphysoderma sedebokerense]